MFSMRSWRRASSQPDPFLGGPSEVDTRLRLVCFFSFSFYYHSQMCVLSLCPQCARRSVSWFPYPSTVLFLYTVCIGVQYVSYGFTVWA